MRAKRTAAIIAALCLFALVFGLVWHKAQENKHYTLVNAGTGEEFVLPEEYRNYDWPSPAPVTPELVARLEDSGEAPCLRGVVQEVAYSGMFLIILPDDWEAPVRFGTSSPESYAVGDRVEIYGSGAVENIAGELIFRPESSIDIVVSK